MDIREKISSDLDIPLSYIDDSLDVARVRVKKLVLKKRNGSPRVVYQPSKKLKTIQYWLIHNVLTKLPVHHASMAYGKGQSILTNAHKHRMSRYFLKMDFHNFFPSIVWRDFEPILIAWHKATTPKWPLDDGAKRLVRLSCFFLKDVLPIGYPSSPFIGNSTMYAMDKKMDNLLSDHSKFGRTVYTRYADDIVISTDKKNVCTQICNVVCKLISESRSPKLKINREKTRFGSSSSGSAMVTGLRMCPDGHITIHRKHKDRIRLFLSLYKKNTLDDASRLSLLGHLAYVRHVAPKFYSTLQKKYFLEIQELQSV